MECIMLDARCIANIIAHARCGCGRARQARHTHPGNSCTPFPTYHRNEQVSTHTVRTRVKNNRTESRMSARTRALAVQPATALDVHAVGHQQ